MVKKTKRNFPEYRRIIQELTKRAEITGGEAVSETLLMRRYGVGRSTANKTLKLLAERGLVRRVQGKGSFLVKPGAPTLSANVIVSQAFVHGLFEPASSRVFAALLNGMLASEASQRCLVKILILPHEGDALRQAERLLALGPRNGVVLFSHDGFEEVLGVLARERFPHVCHAPVGKLFNSVSHDPYRGSVKALEQLAGRTRRGKILFLSRDHRDPWIAPRLAAYRDTLRAHGIPWREAFVLDLSPDDPGGGPAFLKRVKQHGIDGVFAASGELGLHAFRWLGQAGIEIPLQVALVVFDDLPEFERSSPTITALRTPLSRIGGLLLEQLVDMMELGYRDDLRTVLTGELIVRESA